MDWQSALKIIKHFSDIISGSDNIYTNLLLASPRVSWIRKVSSAPLYRSPNYQKRPLLDVPRECFFLCLLDIGIGISVADLLQKISIPIPQRAWIFINFHQKWNSKLYLWFQSLFFLISHKKEISHMITSMNFK